MATTAQLEANRRNAQLSTGPKTTEGKQRSSRNAVKHGILANAIHPKEAPDFHELLLGLYQSLQPMDEPQRFLVDQIGLCMLRLHRTARFEQNFLKCNAVYIAPPEGPQYDREDPPAVSYEARIHHYLHRENSPLVHRYEAAANRQIHKNLQLLKEMKSQTQWQTARQGESPYLVELQDIAEEEAAVPEAPVPSDVSDISDAPPVENPDADPNVIVRTVPKACFYNGNDRDFAPSLFLTREEMEEYGLQELVVESASFRNRKTDRERPAAHAAHAGRNGR
jgi:hypothetical protein